MTRSITDIVEEWAGRGQDAPADEIPDDFAAVRASQWGTIIPRRFIAADVGDFDAGLRGAIHRWHGRPRNMLLLGAVGVGKTHAAVAAAKLLHVDGWRVAFRPVVELLDALRPNGDPQAFVQAVTVDLLILDDLGGERPTDWTLERLYAVVNRRYMEERPIVATSNLRAEDGRGPLVDAVGQRIYSRLVQDAVTVHVGGSDRRRL